MRSPFVPGLTAAAALVFALAWGSTSVTAQSDPRLVDAVRAAQEGRGDGPAPSSTGSSPRRRRPTRSFPRFSTPRRWWRAAGDMRRLLQRVTVERHSAGPTMRCSGWCRWTTPRGTSTGPPGSRTPGARLSRPRPAAAGGLLGRAHLFRRRDRWPLPLAGGWDGTGAERVEVRNQLGYLYQRCDLRADTGAQVRRRTQAASIRPGEYRQARRPPRLRHQALHLVHLRQPRRRLARATRAGAGPASGRHGCAAKCREPSARRECTPPPRRHRLPHQPPPAHAGRERSTEFRSPPSPRGKVRKSRQGASAWPQRDHGRREGPLQGAARRVSARKAAQNAAASLKARLGGMGIHRRGALTDAHVFAPAPADLPAGAARGAARGRRPGGRRRDDELFRWRRPRGPRLPRAPRAAALLLRDRRRQRRTVLHDHRRLRRHRRRPSRAAGHVARGTAAARLRGTSGALRRGGVGPG